MSDTMGDEPISRDQFLSEEDLDLRNLTYEELLAYWQLWLEQAQATNDLDAHTYSHGVFEFEPNVTPEATRSRSSLHLPPGSNLTPSP